LRISRRERRRGVCVLSVCVCAENVSEAARLCLCLQAGSNDDDAAQGLDVGPRTRRCRLRGDELAAAPPPALGALGAMAA